MSDFTVTNINAQISALVSEETNTKPVFNCVEIYGIEVDKINPTNSHALTYDETVNKYVGRALPITQTITDFISMGETIVSQYSHYIVINNLVTHNFYIEFTAQTNNALLLVFNTTILFTGISQPTLTLTMGSSAFTGTNLYVLRISDITVTNENIFCQLNTGGNLQVANNPHKISGTLTHKISPPI
jgi:hypothetical protein